MKNIKGLIVFTTIVFLVSFVYFLFVNNVHPAGTERETLLSEIGEGLGGVGFWLFLVLYGRTVLKLSLGKGAFAQRILPEYAYRPTLPLLKRCLIVLNKTHNYVGIAAVAVIVLHAAFVGLPLDSLFFPVVLALVIWQGVFGVFLAWRYTPKNFKKFSYLAHAQFLTGILIGIFACFGHMLVDN